MTTKKLAEMKLQPGDWFIADIIGPGIYEMIKHGSLQSGRNYARVKVKKLFFKMDSRGHETTCHPIKVNDWNRLKKVK